MMVKGSECWRDAIADEIERAHGITGTAAQAHAVLDGSAGDDQFRPDGGAA